MCINDEIKVSYCLIRFVDERQCLLDTYYIKINDHFVSNIDWVPDTIDHTITYGVGDRIPCNRTILKFDVRHSCDLCITAITDDGVISKIPISSIIRTITLDSGSRRELKKIINDKSKKNQNK